MSRLLKSESRRVVNLVSVATRHFQAMSGAASQEGDLMRMMENVKMSKPMGGMTGLELDAEPGCPEDGNRCQVHGSTMLTEGKYAKKGKNVPIFQQYETDKPYI